MPDVERNTPHEITELSATPPVASVTKIVIARAICHRALTQVTIGAGRVGCGSMVRHCGGKARRTEGKPWKGTPRPSYPRKVMRSMRASARWLVSAALMVIAVGCASHISRGPNLYDQGRYVEAAQAFERTERYLGEASPRDQATYGLYRGMNFLKLGDIGHAQRWLSFATEVERHDPGALGKQDRAMLDRAWHVLLRQREKNPPPAPSSEVATSQLGSAANGEPDARPQ
jgi:hypothetical protein